MKIVGWKNLICLKKIGEHRHKIAAVAVMALSIAIGAALAIYRPFSKGENEGKKNFNKMRAGKYGYDDDYDQGAITRSDLDSLRQPEETKRGADYYDKMAEKLEESEKTGIPIARLVLQGGGEEIGTMCCALCQRGEGFAPFQKKYTERGFQASARYAVMQHILKAHSQDMPKMVELFKFYKGLEKLIKRTETIDHVEVGSDFFQWFRNNYPLNNDRLRTVMTMWEDRFDRDGMPDPDQVAFMARKKAREDLLKEPVKAAPAVKTMAQLLREKRELKAKRFAELEKEFADMEDLDEKRSFLEKPPPKEQIFENANRYQALRDEENRERKAERRKEKIARDPGYEERKQKKKEKHEGLRHSAPAAAKSQMCKFQRKVDCPWGEKCRYIHEEKILVKQESPKEKKPNRRDQDCKFGISCYQKTCVKKTSRRLGESDTGCRCRMEKETKREGT